MENASKALIIAGAILLSILIIGLGMAVYNNANSSMGSANLDQEEARSHNSKFLAYEKRQKGSNVITLLNSIAANNDEYADRQITVSVSTSQTQYDKSGEAKSEEASYFLNGANADDISDLRKEINKKSSTTFNVTYDYANNGLIYYCQIEVYKADTTSTKTTDSNN